MTSTEPVQPNARTLVGGHAAEIGDPAAGHGRQSGQLPEMSLNTAPDDLQTKQALVRYDGMPWNRSVLGCPSLRPYFYGNDVARKPQLPCERSTQSPPRLRRTERIN